MEVVCWQALKRLRSNLIFVWREPRHAGEPGSNISILLAQVQDTDLRWPSCPEANWYSETCNKALRQSSHIQASYWEWSLTDVNSWTMPWQCLGELKFAWAKILQRLREQFNNMEQLQDCAHACALTLFGLLMYMKVLFLSNLSNMSPFVLGRWHLRSALMHTSHLLIVLACAYHTWRSIKTICSASIRQNGYLGIK